jgi:small-conductance mechanosensitive channel
MRPFAILMLVLLAGAVVGDARMPKVGDRVNIEQRAGLMTVGIGGVVTDIDAQLNLIELNATYDYVYFGADSANRTWNNYQPGTHLKCIGIATISSLRNFG